MLILIAKMKNTYLGANVINNFAAIIYEFL